MELIPYNQMSNEAAEDLADRLDELLAEFQIYRQNVRMVYWNGELRSYLGFNDKVELLYQLTEDNREAIAEEIISLGYTPTAHHPHSPHDLVPRQVTLLREVTDFDSAIFGIVRSSRELLKIVREIFHLAGEYAAEPARQLLRELMVQLMLTIRVLSHERLALNN
ncbi:hypothetical protein [Pontibacter sp. G13]|uniref:hypothetical protein n=1 Tax=Pontibacter sp. G13 TaxID=3074898 RepID=UPI00288C0B64|nr:hypothetical protein [Pontibacter sp. G13]WNJ17799.1 hypothetical protein RJD25_23350 [Pontibacter sp. G13]